MVNLVSLKFDSIEKSFAGLMLNRRETTDDDMNTSCSGIAYANEGKKLNVSSLLLIVLIFSKTTAVFSEILLTFFESRQTLYLMM